MWKSTFSILSLVFSLTIMGQPATPEEPKESISFRPHEMKIGVNVSRSIRSLSTSDKLTMREFQTALAMHYYNVVFDFGREEHRRGDSFDYQNKGSYYRVGIDRNFIRDKTSGDVFSLGLRYARANFEDRIEYSSDQGFGEKNLVLENSALTARWVEVALGLRGRLISNLYMGFTMRWQILRQINGEGELKTFEVPGFGGTKRKNSTAIDYYVMWRIPFKKSEDKP